MAGGAKGLGAFSLGAERQVVFREGSVVGSYEGERLSLADVYRRYPDGALGSYIMALNDHVFLDAEDPERSNWTRYCNHSSKRANLEIARGGADSAERVDFVALRDIRSGEELLFDYGPQYWRRSHAAMLDDVLYYDAEYRPVMTDE